MSEWTGAGDGGVNETCALICVGCTRVGPQVTSLSCPTPSSRSLPRRHPHHPLIPPGRPIHPCTGAFTPGCSKTHLPGYINDYEKLKAAGNEITVLLTVNDPFVADAWATSAGAQGKVDVYADPAGEAVKALGVEFDATPFLGNVRSARFSAVVQDGTFKTFNLEDGGGLTCSLSNQILAQLKDA